MQFNTVYRFGVSLAVERQVYKTLVMNFMFMLLQLYH